MDQQGLVTAVANGTATVNAVAEAATGTATIEVAQAPSVVTLAPTTATIPSGATLRMSAVAADANGHIIKGAMFEWTSSAPEVAEVDQSGLVRGVSGGTTTITALSGSASATATVRIVQTIATLDVSPASLTPTQAGKQGRDTIVVTVADAVGNPIAGASYTWTTDRHSGWVWPARGRTGADGPIVVTWVAGWPGNGVLSLTVTNASSRMTTEMATQSTGSRNNPSGAVTIWTNNRGATATAYSIDMTPLAEPPGTYYAAIQWDGGYTGLQRGGSHYDRQLQFSVWDAPGVGGAEVVERGEGVRCYTFGGEGTGQACNLNYPWVVGSTYRFEVTERELNGGSAMTLHVTDLASGMRRFVGTLRFARRARMNGFGMFVEDFWMRGEHCLAREVRSAAIRRAMARINGAWTPLTEGYLSRHPHDYFNLGTPPCANLAARSHSAGLEIVIGGETASDPNSSPRYTIPR